MMARTPEQIARYYAAQKAKRDAAAIAAGRVPGQQGQPSKFTEAERREKRRVKSAKWRAANPDKAKDITRRSMKKANDERAVAAGREPGKRGRPAIALTPEQKRAKQNARVKRYYANNLEKSRDIGALAARNRRARIRKVGGKHTASDIAWLMDQQKGKCVFCLLAFGDEKPHVDHYVPLALGGSNDRSNLRLLHETCNLMKSAKHPISFGMQHGLLAW